MTIYIANAKIIYTPPSTSIVTFSEKTGQPIRDESTSTPIELLVSLEQRQTEPDVVKKEGRDISGIYCTGRILPIGTPIPEWLTADGEFDVEWNDGRVGKAYVLSSVTSRFHLQNFFGQRIQIHFVQKSKNS